jgi:hypothetical protein
MLGSVPFALCYSIHSFRRAPDRPFAAAALGLSAVETAGFLLLVGMIILSLFK